jgi:hypothetical protein
MESRDVVVRPSTGVIRVPDPRAFYEREVAMSVPSRLAWTNERHRAKEYRPRVTHGRPRRTPTARRPQPRPRRRATTRAGPDEPSEPEPPACEVCGASLEDKYRNAKTCSSQCRTAKCRKGKAPAPSAELLLRHEAALSLLPELAPEERLDLLAAVVWPQDERLQEAA